MAKGKTAVRQKQAPHIRNPGKWKHGLKYPGFIQIELLAFSSSRNRSSHGRHVGVVLGGDGPALPAVPAADARPGRGAGVRHQHALAPQQNARWELGAAK